MISEEDKRRIEANALELWPVNLIHIWDKTTYFNLNLRLETATVRGRELQTMLQIVVEDVAIFYRKTGIIFSVSKKISEKPDREKKII